MLLCERCSESAWEVERLPTHLFVYCCGIRKVDFDTYSANNVHHVEWERCGYSFELPPWYNFIPTIRRGRNELAH